MTSSSPQSTTHRLRRGVLALLLCLLLLEISVRLPPVHAALSTALDPYESLLWYDNSMLAYQNLLRDGQQHDLWMLGSSYMMTALDPRIVQAQLAATGNLTTVQNYGYTVMQNLSDMAVVVERWMFSFYKPRYALIGLHWGNFSADGRRTARARTSPMERSLIFQDTLNDRLGGVIYRNSALFRFATLARNALTIAPERTVIPTLTEGGYTAAVTDKVFGCDPTSYTDVNKVTQEQFDSHLVRLDTLIDALQRNGVTVGVVSIPNSYCSYRRFYATPEDYVQLYLDPLAAHLQARGISYAELDRRFFSAYPDGEEQASFYYNASHAKLKGAELFSAWTGEFVASWLNGQEQ